MSDGKGTFSTFLDKLPRWAVVLLATLVSVSAAALVIGTVAQGREISLGPIKLGPRPVSCGDTLMLIPRGQPITVGPKVTVELLGIKSLEGHRNDGDPNGGHPANLRLVDVDHVLGNIVERCNLEKFTTPQEIKAWSHERWSEFLGDITENKRNCILDRPFARFSVRANGDEKSYFVQRHFFKGEEFEPAPGINLRVAAIFEVTHIHSGEFDSVVLEKVPEH